MTSQPKDLLLTIQEALNYIKDRMETEPFETYSFLFDDILEGIHSINNSLFHNAAISIFDMDALFSELPGSRNISNTIEQCESWCLFIRNKITERENYPTELDENFYDLIDYVRYVKFESIFEQTKKQILSRDAHTIEMFNQYYQFYHYLWKSLDTQNNIYDVVKDRIQNLIAHQKEFTDLYEMLGDYRSKQVLYHFVYYWLNYDLNSILSMKENNFRDYYDLDLLQCNENEVVVDLGAFDGDSALDYIKTYRKYKKIYCYEITPATVKKLKQNLNGFPNIDIRNKGAGSAETTMYLNGKDAEDSGNSLSSEGNIAIDVVTIDDDIPEAVTLIKMDIEGAEQDALKGCKRHIKEERPKLLICVYHNNRDIYEIPKLIQSMRNDYRFYLRSNGNQWGPSEIVLFAL